MNTEHLHISDAIETVVFGTEGGGLYLLQATAIRWIDEFLGADHRLGYISVIQPEGDIPVMENFRTRWLRIPIVGEPFDLNTPTGRRTTSLVTQIETDGFRICPPRGA